MNTYRIEMSEHSDAAKTDYVDWVRKERKLTPITHDSKSNWLKSPI